MRKLKRVSLIIPLVIFIVCLFWILNYLDQYDQTYYNLVFEEQTVKVDHIVSAVDTLKTIGLTYGSDHELFDSLVSNEIERINLTTGVSACIFTLDFEYVIGGSREPNLYGVFDIEHPDYEKLTFAMNHKPSGEILVNEKSNPMKIYWKQMPSLNPNHFIVVGVDDGEILRNVNVVPLKIFTLAVSILMVISVYDSIFWRMKKKHE